MTIEIVGLEGDRRLATTVTRKMAAVAGRLKVAPVRSQVAFVDDNGPKGGPAIRCAITVRLPYRPAVRVERAAERQRLAFDAAFEVLDRQLERYRTIERDRRRRPKKYYAARKLLTS
jgi:ribosome-associated translation inhibitor RaiA